MLYNRIKIEPFDFKIINYLKITKQPNEHSRLHIFADLDESVNSSYIEQELDKKVVKAIFKYSEKKEQLILFSGVIDTIEVSFINGVYKVEIEACSHTQNIDTKKINRSYQDIEATYEDIMTRCLDSYSDAAILDMVTKGASTDKFILQYNETPWEFLKRMASRFHAALIVEDGLDDPKLYIGFPEKDDVGDLESFTYSINKDMGRYRKDSNNFENSYTEDDYSYYEITTERIFEIANKVKFNNSILYVIEVNIEMTNGFFKNTYKLAEKPQLAIPLIKNENVIGLSLEGQVVEVEKDKVKILLDIDLEHSKQELCFFKYSTMYADKENGGFYCMPELGERVRLYVPTIDEEDAFADGMPRSEFKAEGDWANPNIKYLRTKAGKEIMFMEDAIKISCLDNEIYINLSEKDGIVLTSSKGISLVANDGSDINISAEGKIVLSAEDELDAFCAGSQLNMKSGKSVLKGNAIEIN